MNLNKYAAIDIGSNAIRLLIMNVVEDEDEDDIGFQKSSLIRMPVRLGNEVFTTGIISEKNCKRLSLAMEGFSKFIELSDVVAYRACATSAMREATNSLEVIEYVKEKSGLQIELISGQEEAEILYSTHLGNIVKNRNTYLYIDVGGGSTEMTLFSNKERLTSDSFRIGTLRLLNKKVGFQEIRRMKKWLNEIKFKYSSITVIGSGGNINKIFKLKNKAPDQTLYRDELGEFYYSIKNLTVNERIKKLGLNPDRADVIEPAAKIFLKAMKWSGAHQIMVPKIGLADGIIQNLYAKHNA